MLVGLQSGDPELYAQAAREYRHICENGHNLYFWDAQTEAGDSPEGHGDDDADPEEWINIHFAEDREWLETNDAEEEHDDGSGEAAEEVPMVVARPSPTQAEGFDYESDT